MIFTYMFTCFFTLEIFVGITERKKPKLPPGPRRMSARTCSRKLFGYEGGYRSYSVCAVLESTIQTMAGLNTEPS